MKFAIIPLIALLSAVPTTMAVPEPAAVRAAADAVASYMPSMNDPSGAVKRDNAAVVKVDGLESRVCPRIEKDCPVVKKFAKNTPINLECYTRDNTTPVKCDLGWGKIVGCEEWVPLAWGTDVAWTGGLPYC